MRRKSSKQLFSVLMAATMVMSGISIPVNASQVDDAVVRSVLTKTEATASESRGNQFQRRLEVPLRRCRECREKGF